ncbi:tetratricopeptide repeat protein [Nocardia nepalensis]|uniref:tetratricopeptide repeat protein n=1 Tax=Nocardia nepalensis TaxID=3375448 RepID=UPI003B671A75
MAIVSGPSKAGKTRSLFEAVRTRMPEARILVPTPESLFRVPGCRAFLDSTATIVVWLDDVERFLVSTQGLTSVVLNRLLARNSPTVVVATLRNDQRRLLRGDAGEFSYDIRMVLEQAEEITLRPTSDDPEEQAAAAAAYPQLNLAGYGLGEILSGAPDMLQRYDDALYGNPALRAVLEVAVDWARIGRVDPVPESALLELALDTIEDLRPDLEMSGEDILTAIGVARQRPQGAGRIAPLVTTRLHNGTLAYRAFEYLVAADNGDDLRPARPIPKSFWHRGTRDAEPGVLATVGTHAMLNRRMEQAVELWCRAGEAGGSRRITQLGEMVAGDHTELRSAAHAGDVDAMYRLGVRLGGWSDFDEAEHWLHRAAQAGHAEAMTFMAMFADERGDHVARQAWLGRAADAGDPDAMYALGMHLREAGQANEAEAWIRRAAELSHREAMSRLGWLMHERSRLSEAERWWTRAAAAGDAYAMDNVAILLKQQGRNADAERWWRKAATLGNPEGMNGLALHLVGSGHADEAEHWWRTAAAQDHTESMHNLGVLLLNRRSSEAGVWLRRAADDGHPDANYLLGVMVNSFGSPEAEYWFQRAADVGHQGAISALDRLT